MINQKEYQQKSVTKADFQAGMALYSTVSSQLFKEMSTQKDLQRVNKYNELKAFQYFIKESHRSSPEAALDKMTEHLQPLTDYYDSNSQTSNILEALEAISTSCKTPASSQEIDLPMYFEIEDEDGQNYVFREDFYTIGQWMKDKKV